MPKITFFIPNSERKCTRTVRNIRPYFWNDKQDGFSGTVSVNDIEYTAWSRDGKTNWVISDED